MHELAIAEAILVIATAHAAGAPRITTIEVRVGHLRQVVPEALRFNFELVAQGTPAAGAELAIEEVPATGRCCACGASARLAAWPLRCSECGGLDVELTGGEELLVSALEVEREPGGIAA
jgi:hydrogenase nickel incorporation protein HypA/HybF